MSRRRLGRSLVHESAGAAAVAIADVATLTDAARSHFARIFGASGCEITRASGRVNLIGDHTDYNEGFVLPMALPLGVAVAFTRREDDRVRAYAASYDALREFSNDALTPPAETHWSTYVEAVAWALRASGVVVGGLDMAIVGDLPIGAGLASSAALEVAVARAMCAAASVAWDPPRMARVAQQAESEYVGVPCGIMDQISAAEDRIGHALLVDCRSLDRHAVALPANAAVVIMDSGVARSLARSAYAERRRECQRAVDVIRTMAPEVRALRDVDARLLAHAEARLDPVVARRAWHVIEENARPQAMARALEAGDLEAAGRLMDDSHRSLRDLYEVSCAELDALVAAARRHPACYGARMTGAGFGGCAVALVNAYHAEDFVSRLPQRAWICAGIDQRA